MNHFLCFMVFFLAFLRVGGSEPQPLISKVVGDNNVAKKEKGLYMEVWGSTLSQWKAEHRTRRPGFKSSVVPSGVRLIASVRT